MNAPFGSHLRPLHEVDPEIARAIDLEVDRQSRTVELIASENFVSEAVLEALGSVMTNKYAEGLPGKRYYGGCEYVDIAENLAIERSKKLFGAEHANVQAHSGSQANQAVYLTVLKPGDTLLGMSLAHGGHLTHGHPLNFSGKMYKIISYGVSKETETIDYDELERLAKEHQPKLILAGASAYPRTLDFPRFAAIAREVGAVLMVDMAHIAGLIAAGLHSSPFPHADFVTTTTHKTLRGPRGGAVFCKEQYRQRPRQDCVPRHPGRAADARDRRQSRMLPRSPSAGVRRVPEADCSQRPGDGGSAGGGRLPHCRRWNGHAPDAGRCVHQESHRPSGAGNSGTRQHYRQQKCHPL